MSGNKIIKINDSYVLASTVVSVRERHEPHEYYKRRTAITTVDGHWFDQYESTAILRALRDAGVPLFDFRAKFSGEDTVTALSINLDHVVEVTGRLTKYVYEHCGDERRTPKEYFLYYLTASRQQHEAEAEDHDRLLNAWKRRHGMSL